MGMKLKNFIKGGAVGVVSGLVILSVIGVNETQAIPKEQKEQGKTTIEKVQTREGIEAYTMYGIGSVSKMFGAVAVMQLVDEGKIDLDTPLIHYIPDFEMADERYKAITARMLLNHTSGIMQVNKIQHGNDNLTNNNFIRILNVYYSILFFQSFAIG